MTLEEYKSRQREAHEAIAKVLNEYADVVGLRYCTIHDSSDPDQCGCDVTNSIPAQAFLSEWIVCMAWTAVESGENGITDFSSDNMLLTHAIGLLRATQVIAESQF